MKSVKAVETVEEISKRFGVSRTAVYHWIDEGLKHNREKVIGRKVRIIIDPADVYAFHREKSIRTTIAKDSINSKLED